MNTHVIDTPEYEAGHEAELAPVEARRGPLEWCKRLYVEYREWARYRAAVRELSLMEDSRLADIGILRSEIRATVRQAMEDNKRRSRRSATAMQRAA